MSSILNQLVKEDYILQNRLRKLRKSLNKQQGEFANDLGILQQQYSTYERGTRKPSTEIYNKLIEIFNVNLNWLLTGNGSMFLDKNSDVITVKLKKGQLLNVEYEE